MNEWNLYQGLCQLCVREKDLAGVMLTMWKWIELIGWNFIGVWWKYESDVGRELNKGSFEKVNKGKQFSA